LRSATDELTTLRAKHATNTAQLTVLTREKAVLTQKVRDRDEEIQGKRGFVQETQDEMISLNLQLNMSEQRNERLTRENEELIARWMERKEVEAEEMNRVWAK
jgi:hypothetical protein